MKDLISIVVLTHNSQKTIENCLDSLVDFSNVLVIDDESTDATLALCKNYTNVTVQSHQLHGNYANIRNFALLNAGTKWVFFIDSDEVMEQNLSRELINFENNQNDNSFVAYLIKRQDIFWGKKLKYGELQKASTHGIIRFVKVDGGRFYGDVHEEFKPKGEVGRLEGNLLHYAHDSIASFLVKINNYSSIRANELNEKGKKSNYFQILFFPIGKFIYTFFLKFGFIDGAGGFVYSFMMSFHSFLVRGKLYLLQNSK